MRAAAYDAMTAIERFRLLVRNFNGVRESFCSRFDQASLLKIHRAWLTSEWDIPPDNWTPRQLQDALSVGRAPTWDDNEYPTYGEFPHNRAEEREEQAG